MNKLKLNEFSRRVFQKVDKDKSGFIEKEELRSLLIMMAKEMNTKVRIIYKVESNRIRSQFCYELFRY